MVISDNERKRAEKWILHQIESIHYDTNEFQFKTKEIMIQIGYNHAMWNVPKNRWDMFGIDPKNIKGDMRIVVYKNNHDEKESSTTLYFEKELPFAPDHKIKFDLGIEFSIPIEIEIITHDIWDKAFHVEFVGYVVDPQRYHHYQ